ncbi:uncharacterized protein SPPG_07288 [Spizellomyces punctatus DAOM BR117]|uniref:Oxidoreductase AflY n=1 Tax=Spizellomyces punctatus (strain DAOM BR117) TaxID=645134 RepID=A0A0L0H8P5_SPIPD|nr:uncharacterized protein SPPG_07288 [Spizellomyces punctatus DAOM BR117]KNC97361.1 hypothetical protein SPPG_07288 [Spizellomyces punctatus DAOM BR117]|eukprot:XP_016605401.1 hypothetical protein SPPG_07288 [Spizellomyces punctatus DAOM BR117]
MLATTRTAPPIKRSLQGVTASASKKIKLHQMTMLTATAPTSARPLTPLVTSLLERNHNEHHMYFAGGLHNHFPHTLLSQFALGASEQRLNREWSLEDPDLEKLGEPVENIVLNEKNWRDYIGIRRYYPNYLKFFDHLVQRDGIIPTTVKYAFDPVLIPSVLSGLLHPLIHIGFGVEFSSPLVTAEGLAEACTHQPKMKPVLDASRKHSELNQPASHSKYNTKRIVEFFDTLRKDPRLDGLVTVENDDKTAATIQKCAEVIAEYANLWTIEETPAGIQDALHTLFHTTTDLYASTGLRPGHPASPRLDFFLLHLLTATLATRHLLPHLSIDASRDLLHAHFTICLTFYIARGRPPVQPTLLLALPVKNSPALKTWEQIVHYAHESEDLHVPKVIRTLKIAEEMYGPENDLWIQVARLTIDKLVIKGGQWDRDGCGYEETWGG